MSDHPSGSHNIATIREAVVIADAAVEKTARATRLQWLGLGVLGSISVGVGGFVAWCLITLGAIGSAQAQSSAKAEAALDKGRQLEQRVESIDAGMRAVAERLERKIDASNEKTDAKLEAMQRTMVEVLREVKKR